MRPTEEKSWPIVIQAAISSNLYRNRRRLRQRKISALKAKRPVVSGRSFLRWRVYTTFYFSVKGNLKLFLFLLELTCFQEHSSPIPQPISPCAVSGLARVHAS